MYKQTKVKPLGKKKTTEDSEPKEQQKVLHWVPHCYRCMQVNSWLESKWAPSFNDHQQTEYTGYWLQCCWEWSYHGEGLPFTVQRRVLRRRNTSRITPSGDLQTCAHSLAGNKEGATCTERTSQARIGQTVKNSNNSECNYTHKVDIGTCSDNKKEWKS